VTEPVVEGFSGPPGATRSGPAVPRVLAERARDLSDGRLTPAVPRDAATVILLRPAEPGFEAFLLRRTAELEFAPGACVFPGGSVDERDADPGIGWAGPGPEDFAARLDVPPERARALVCAAIRETFEESGVLLAGSAGPAGDGAGLVNDSAALAADRHALLTGAMSFGEVLGRRGLVFRTDLLTPWARWITPEVSPRRYDTWFFAAVLPPGQTATAAPEGHADPGESESGTWLRPDAALEAAEAGQITLLPPTAVTLRELGGHHDVDGILTRRMVITPRLPRVVVEDGKVRLTMPQPGQESP
jgi:8-oxo-dGTP pyrophosphatase MutT (NUDIX family)